MFDFVEEISGNAHSFTKVRYHCTVNLLKNWFRLKLDMAVVDINNNVL